MTQVRLFSLVLLLTATALSCGAGQDPCQVVGCRADAGTPIEDASATETGPDGGTVDPLPAGCQIPRLALDPAACLTPELDAAYVSPKGSDANDGTKDKPFLTIGKALGTSRRRVVVCEGNYAEELKIGRGVEIYGGIDCDFAARGGPAQLMAASGKETALVIADASKVVLADVEVRGPSIGVPSSIAVWASGAQADFYRVALVAGSGAAGAAGKLDAFTLDVRAKEGDPAVANAAGAGGTQSCPGGGTSGSGGIGGGGGGQSGGAGGPLSSGGMPGDFSKACNMGGGGGDAPMTAPLTPAAGAKVLGKVQDTRWIAESGVPGVTGTAGKGGGGGAGRNTGTSGGGGGGGAGGCGGAGEERVPEAARVSRWFPLLPRSSCTGVTFVLRKPAKAARGQRAKPVSSEATPATEFRLAVEGAPGPTGPRARAEAAEQVESAPRSPPKTRSPSATTPLS